MNLRKLQAKKVTEVTKDEMERIANVERFKVEASLALANEVERQKIRRVELGERIGKTKSFITKILNGSHNFTLETLADVSWALGYAVHISLARDFGELRSHVIEAPAPKYHPSDTITISPFESDRQVMGSHFEVVGDSALLEVA